MTSPVDTSVKHARSDMVGAPILKTQAGSLIALLDAFLVNGWGLQTATSVVVTGGVATATFPLDHAAFVDAVVLVAGATPTSLNGEQKITATAPNKISWATAAADGTANGTITVKMAAAGWAKPFTGTNLAVYRSLDPQSAGLFLRVNDANALYARVVGYETMSTVSAGTGPFPTNTQISGGGYWNKGSNPHAAAVPWVLSSDGRFLHLTSCGDAPTGELYMYSEVYCFGDIVSASATADPFSTLIGVSSAAGTYTDTTSAGDAGYSLGMFLARGMEKTMGAKSVGVNFNTHTSLPTFPDMCSGGTWLSPAMVKEGNASTGAILAYRGRLPGVMANHTTGLAWRLGGNWPLLNMGGRSYLFQPYQAGALGKTVAYDLTGPWR